MKKYIRLTTVLMTIIFFSLNLCSCYDDMEMNELAYVIALGIDTADGGEYNYTFQISNPLASGGGGESPKKEMSEEDERKDENSQEWDKSQIEDNKNSGVMEVVVKASDYVEAAELVNNIISKRINLAHLKVIVFSEDAGRKGIDKHTKFLMNEREIRPGTNVMVAKKSAEYFLKNINPKLDMNTAKYYELLINNENMNYSRAVELRELYDKGFGADAVDGILPLGDVSDKTKSAEFSESNENNTNENSYQNSESNSQPEKSSTIAGETNRLSGEKTELFGAAVINDMKMVGIIDGEEVKYYKLLLGELKDGGTFSDKDKRIILKNIKKPCITINTDEEYPQISITVFAEVDNTNSISELEKDIEDNIYMFLLKTSREYEADIFGFSNYAKMNFPTWQKFEDYDWNTVYKNSVFSVHVSLMSSKFKLSRFLSE